MTPATPARTLVNLRDVAHLVGQPYLRPGVLWRSEAPHGGDAAPRWPTGRPPRTVVDLRSPNEHRPDDLHPLAGPTTALVELPLLASLSPAEQDRVRADGTTPARLYGQLLDTADGWLARLVAVAASAPSPLLVHCAAGKDRTSVVVALLVSLLGAPRAGVVADHLATNDVLDDLLPRLGRSRNVHEPGPFDSVGEDAIAAVLDRIGPDPDAFHRAHGVAASDITRWRERARP